MAKITTENLIWKFFEKWKEKRLNKFGKDLLKKDPQLEKNLKAMDAEYDKIIKRLKKVK